MFSVHLLAGNKLIVGIYDDYPFSYIDEDGNYSGISLDLLDYIAKIEEWELEYIYLPFSESLERLKNGEIDIQTAIAFSEERNIIYDFSEEIILINWGIVFVKANSTIHSLTDLDLKKVALIPGDSHAVKFKKIIDSYDINIEIVYIDTYFNIFEAVRKGDVDAGIAPRLFGIKYKDEYGLIDNPIIFNPINIGYAFPKNTHLDIKEALDKQLSELKADKNSIFYQSINNYFAVAQKKFDLIAFLKNLLLIFSLIVIISLLFVVSRTPVKLKTKELEEKNKLYENEIIERKKAEIEIRKLNVKWKRESDELIKAQDILFELNRKEMIAMDETVHAQELVEELSRRELMDKDQIIEALEKLKELARKEQIEKDRIIKKMEMELDLARKIQRSMVPAESPTDILAFYYKPMDKIGGDFFDFMKFQEKGKLGMFLSDVSGHGVPAAFITTMVKSFILQYGSNIDDPGQFLMLLNEALTGRTRGSNLTALYGIYESKTRKFTYANAGHNPPYLVTNEKVEYLNHDNSSFPLLSFDNQKLISINMEYKNNTVILEKDSKLFLYTDGLVEAVNIQARKKYHYDRMVNFEEGGLISVLKENKKLSCKKLVDLVIKKLTAFRGGNSFDDDICLICVDIKN